ncbi:hypothetical protein OCV73_06880 [Barnesiella propionica]|uniref:hypothetical protein n=1 Tax=Barnesiella propionica TaxID=2981781 RepID=UPI0011CA5696|nr:hypothetical protein [Barnesiella propionica]MCU6768671.1 hypothetical protein [Barnesiella propionica]
MPVRNTLTLRNAVDIYKSGLQDEQALKLIEETVADAILQSLSPEYMGCGLYEATGHIECEPSIDADYCFRKWGYIEESNYFEPSFFVCTSCDLEIVLWITGDHGEPYYLDTTELERYFCKSERLL